MLKRRSALNQYTTMPLFFPLQVCRAAVVGVLELQLGVFGRVGRGMLLQSTPCNQMRERVLLEVHGQGAFLDLLFIAVASSDRVRVSHSVRSTCIDR